MAHIPPFQHVRRSRGFTLVELIMVIVILGAISGAVAVFMKTPIDAYLATARRGGIADMADTTVRRMSRDIRKALPNSIRLSTDQCIEFIPTRSGGRYRANTDSLGAGDILDFATTDTSFDVLGDTGTAAVPPDERVVAGDFMAVYNLGIPGADAYNLDNVALIKSTASGAIASNVVITGDTTNIGSVVGKKFPLASASSRFHVIPTDEKVVAYRCDAATKKLFRYSNYAYNAATACAVSGTPAVIANEATCAFSYGAADVRNALVQLNLTFADGGETASVYNEVHINNTP